MASPKIHLTVRVLPPQDAPNPPAAASFLINLPPELTFLVAWKQILTRYQRDYPRHDDWVFKKIQDAYGADISLGDSVGDVFAGEDRARCVIQVVQRLSHREETVPEGSYLQPQDQARRLDDKLLQEHAKLRRQEARYGTVAAGLDPDHPVESGEQRREQEQDTAPRSKRPRVRVSETPDRDLRRAAADKAQALSVMVGRIGNDAHTTPDKDNTQLTPRSLDNDDSVVFKKPLLATRRLEIPDSPQSEARQVASPRPSSPTPDRGDIAIEDPIQDPIQDPIEDDGEANHRHHPTTPSSRPRQVRQPVLPSKALEKLRRRRLSRGENPDLTQQPDAPPSSGIEASAAKPSCNARLESQRKSNLARSWTEKDTDTLVTAIARGLANRTIHERHFPQRTWDSVRKKISNIQKNHSPEIKARKQTLERLESEESKDNASNNSVRPVETGSEEPIQTPVHGTASSRFTPVVEVESSHRPKETTHRRPTPKQGATPSVWSEGDDDIFVRAIREGQDWRSLHDRRYPTRTQDSVKIHFAEIHRRVEHADAEKHAAERVKFLEEKNEPPSAPGERFKPYEEHLLLAARLENVEMKRFLKDYFPLDRQERAKSLAAKLYQDARRKASKVLNSQSSPSQPPAGSAEFTASQASASDALNPQLIMNSLDQCTRQGVEEKRQQLRLDARKYAEDRNQEHRLSQRLANDRARTSEARERADRNNRLSSQVEELQQREDEIKSRRLAEDLKNERLYWREYREWASQAEADKASGRAVKSPPRKPAPSRIGTEVATVQPRVTRSKLSRDASSDPSQPVAKAQPRTADTRREPESQKRKTSTIVEVVIPVPKKRKTDSPGMSQQKKAPPSGQTPGPDDSDASIVKTKSPYSLQMAIASQEGDAERFALTQPRPEKSSKHDSNRSFSSPIKRKQSSITSALKRVNSKTRQSTLSFPQRTTRSTPNTAVSSRPRAPVSIFISDDESSTYSDSDLDDETLTELAERSSQAFRSSPPPADVGATDDVQSRTPAANENDGNEEMAGDDDDVVATNSATTALPEPDVHAVLPASASAEQSVHVPSSQEDRATPKPLTTSSDQPSPSPSLQRHDSPDRPVTAPAHASKPASAMQRSSQPAAVVSESPAVENHDNVPSASLPDRLSHASKGTEETTALILDVLSGKTKVTGSPAEDANKGDVDEERDSALQPDDEDFVEALALVESPSMKASEANISMHHNDDSDVEEMNNSEIYRSPSPSLPHTHVAQQGDGHDDSEEEDDDDYMMDMDDARDMAYANGQYFQGDAPGTWTHVSDLQKELDGPSLQLLEESSRAMDDLPSLRSPQRHAMQSARVEDDMSDRLPLQEMAPPFPLSRRGRSPSPFSQRNHKLSDDSDLSESFRFDHHHDRSQAPEPEANNDAMPPPRLTIVSSAKKSKSLQSPSLGRSSVSSPELMRRRSSSGLDLAAKSNRAYSKPSWKDALISRRHSSSNTLPTASSSASKASKSKKKKSGSGSSDKKRRASLLVGLLSGGAKNDNKRKKTQKRRGSALGTS